GRVLHADALDARVAVVAGVAALGRAIELVIVLGLLDRAPAAVPVGGIRLHRLEGEWAVRLGRRGARAARRHRERHGVRVVHGHARAAALLGAEHAGRGEGIEGEAPLGDAPVGLVVGGAWTSSAVGRAAFGVDDLEVGGFDAQLELGEAARDLVFGF